jgi:ABC-type Mn2+/Zn2+ transport system ATPase subunit
MHHFVTFRMRSSPGEGGIPVGYAARVRLEAVGKRYGARQPWVVRDVSLDVGPGRLVRVSGRNGSGKSTLLKVAAGVCLPSAGRVTGRPRAGYVPERFPGGLPFSAREYLLHMARLHGLPGTAGGRAVDEWLERLGAAGYAGAPLRSLSKGMCQKVAIAQALLSRPGLLVLDEAWTGLDQAARGALDAAVVESVADGAIALFVDHDLARLAGRASQRWQLGGAGRVTVAEGDSAGADTAAGDTAAGDTAAGDTAAGDTAGPGSRPADSVVVIEVEGLEPGSLAHAGELPGVLSCDGPAVRVLASYSDDVLRALLSWDGVHVASVGRDAGAQR